jgi:lysyl-tRNA synthetase class II
MTSEKSVGCGKMAYPEPTNPLSQEESEEFVKRLEDFKLTNEQKAMYRGCRDKYRQHVAMQAQSEE